MSEPIVHKSQEVYVGYDRLSLLEMNAKDGLNWKWEYYKVLAPIDSWRKVENCAYLSWKFEWDEEKMKKKGIYGFEGDITVQNIKKEGVNTTFRINVNLTKSGRYIQKRMGTVGEVTISGDECIRGFQYEFTLNKIRVGPVGPKRINDAVLVVEGVKINVNRNNLAIRSDKFKTLFKSLNKKKSELPIEDVKYMNFVSLLGVIDPTNPANPTDNNADILLELADRFIMPAVTNHVENYLLNNSDLPFCDILELADEFKLEKLLEQCLSMITTKKHVEDIKNRVDHRDLSESTRLKLLDRIMSIV